MCFSAMVNALTQPKSAYVVERPRAGDAIGSALRTAYRDRTVPGDMTALLNRLDAIPDCRGT